MNAGVEAVEHGPVAPGGNLSLADPLRGEELGEVRLGPCLEVADPGKIQEMAGVAPRERLRELAVLARVGLPGAGLDVARTMPALGPGGRPVDGEHDLEAVCPRAPDDVVEVTEVVGRIC